MQIGRHVFLAAALSGTQTAGRATEGHPTSRRVRRFLGGEALWSRGHARPS